MVVCGVFWQCWVGSIINAANKAEEEGIQLGGLDKHGKKQKKATSQ